MPLISVIVPVYKVEKVLARCIDSILAQTFSDFELILVDDGSTDRSGEICDNYAMRDSRIRVIHQKNSGVSAARNAGIELSVGQYIAFVDSDDYIANDYLQALFDCDCDLAICGQETLDQNGVQMCSIDHPAGGFSEHQEINYAYLYKNLMLYSPYCKLFRTDIIKKNLIKFTSGITWGEDGMFVADYLPYVSSIQVLSYTGYYYIKYDSQGSLSSRVRRDVVDMITLSREYCIEKIRDYAPDAYETVKKVVTNDICCNCGYFLEVLLQSNMNRDEKRDMLAYFLTSKYVKLVISEPHKYVADEGIVKVLSESYDADMIIKRYRWIYLKVQMKRRLFLMYDSVPECAKDMYRRIKRRVRK